MSRPCSKEGMAQCISRLHPFVGIECKTVLEEINEVVQIPRFRVIHP